MLQNSAHLETVNTTQDWQPTKHQQTAAEDGVTTADTLPYMYLSWKAHKDKWRPIAGTTSNNPEYQDITGQTVNDAAIEQDECNEEGEIINEAGITGDIVYEQEDFNTSFRRR